MKNNTLFGSTRCVAVKFLDENTRLLGEQVLFAKACEGVGLRGGIHLVWKKDLVHLDRAGIKYTHYYPRTSETKEIYEAFGVKV